MNARPRLCFALLASLGLAFTAGSGVAGGIKPRLAAASLDCPYIDPATLSATTDVPFANLAWHGLGISIAHGFYLTERGPYHLERPIVLKFPWTWWPEVGDELVVTTRRLDRVDGAARVEFPTRVITRPWGTENVLIQPIVVRFPNPGCWEITGRVGDTRVSFVVMIINPRALVRPFS